MNTPPATRRHFAGLLSLAALAPLAALQPAAAQGHYPDKAVRIIVPYTPGGFNDTMARLFSRRLQDALGQPFIVENRAGSGTTIGTDAAAKAAPDGYTLLVQGFPLTVNQYLYAKLPYDTHKSFTPVMLGGQTPNLLVVRAESPIKSMKQLIELAKAKPGQLNYASAGNGTSLHLAMEYFKLVTGTDLNQIPYKGSAPMVTDLLGGQVDVMFDNLPNALPHVKAGKMRALAVTAPKRLAELPDVPTVAEQGYPGFEVSVWYGIFAPAGTPAAIVNKLNAELNKALQADEVKAAFAVQGVEALGGSADDFRRFNAAQDKKWAEVIRKGGIKAD
jgi:tripartite-type tricarboxylate transporter receptor subunit TctC